MIKFIANSCALIAILLLTSCDGIRKVGDEEFDDYCVQFDNFTPKGLPKTNKYQLIAFSSIHDGFLTTAYDEDFSLYNTIDRGRHWRKAYKGSGFCEELLAGKDNDAYLVTWSAKDSTSRILHYSYNPIAELLTERKPLQRFHLFEDGTMAVVIKRPGKGFIRNDSLIVRKANESLWKGISLNGMLDGDNVIYGEDCIFAVTHSDQGTQIFYIDLQDGSSSLIESDEFWCMPQYSDHLIGNNGNFYSYDQGKLTLVGNDYWDGPHNTWTYATYFLAKKENIAVNYSSRYSSRTKANSLSYSVNGGQSWKQLIVGNQFIYENGGVARLPSNDALSIIWCGLNRTLEQIPAGYEDARMHILTIKKKAEQITVKQARAYFDSTYAVQTSKWHKRTDSPFYPQQIRPKWRDVRYSSANSMEALDFAVFSGKGLEYMKLNNDGSSDSDSRTKVVQRLVVRKNQMTGRLSYEYLYILPDKGRANVKAAEAFRSQSMSCEKFNGIAVYVNPVTGDMKRVVEFVDGQIRRKVSLNPSSKNYYKDLSRAKSIIGQRCFVSSK